MASRTARIPVGSGAWISEERASALNMAEQEAEEFSFAARNEFDWLNEHMGDIFNENQINVAEIFKTPGKLRGKTPRTIRKKGTPLETRAPLTDIFSATPRGMQSPFRQPALERPAPSFQVAEDSLPFSQETTQPHKPVALVDSGYHGSQTSVATDVELQSPKKLQPRQSPTRTPAKIAMKDDEFEKSEERRTTRNTEESFQSAKEEQTVVIPLNKAVESAEQAELEILPTMVSPQQEPTVPQHVEQDIPMEVHSSPPVQARTEEASISAEQIFEDPQSPSEGSSPMRPIVRKSSLNFASLPAREPLTTKQSIGNRVSRTSHLDQSRTSYYGRQTGSKSIGGHHRQEQDDEQDIDMDELAAEPEELKMTRIHNKTSTQRLQDQISMLGQSQSQTTRPSKSIPSMTATHPVPLPVAPQETKSQASPARREPTMSAPGAFPEDEEDSWIGPHSNAAAGPTIFSPRPALTKSHTVPVMESVPDKDDGSYFNVPKQRSPVRELPERTNSPWGHMKSASTSVLYSPSKGKEAEELAAKKTISVSNPNFSSQNTYSPPKSPSRSLRDSPLKAAKDKISSILKTSRGLFASSAAVSAEAYSSTLSPPSARLGHQSLEDIFRPQSTKEQALYPSLESRPDSPSKLQSVRKTRASTEREEKRKEKEAREARLMKEQLEKLEKLRQRETEKARNWTEKARNFSQERQEQERVAAMKKQVAEQKEQEKLAEQERHTNAAEADIPRSTRTSPRKTKAQLESEGRAAATASTIDVSDLDVEMIDVPKTMPPPAVPRPGSRIAKNMKESKRIAKPTGQPMRGTKPVAAPLHIRVQTGVHGGAHRPMHPSNSTLASSLGDSLAPSSSASSLHTQPKPTLQHKASTSSMQSFKSNVSTKKPAALAAAARKKEQDDLAAQKRRDEKLEAQRRRAQQEEDRRQEQQRQEEERRAADRREVERRQQAATIANQMDMNKSQRQILERAKLERPPPPPSRAQVISNVEQPLSLDKPLPAAPGHRGDIGHARQYPKPTTQRPQEELPRSTSSLAQNPTRAPPKRAFQQDNEDSHRPQLPRNGPSYTQNAEKRRRTGEDLDEVSEQPARAPMPPPIRHSSVRPQKEVQTKSLFPNGYANAPPAHAPSTLLHQATRTAQQMQQTKPAHPMDMAHNSKATINFAPNPAQSHKTPARPVATGHHKSSAKPAKSSPRYANGETIDLPEIHTDSEDEDSDDGGKNNFTLPDWANSPALRSGLMAQEGLDPVSVFGRPGELKMEEVFKNKERWGRFRARTSSANWSGTDRLTEDDIQRDLEARDRLRREGGWSYGLS